MAKFFWNLMHFRTANQPERLCLIKDALRVQDQFLQQKIAGDAFNFIIFAEHDKTYACTQADQEKMNTLGDKAKLLRPHAGRLPAPLYVIPENRAGSITYHGPGQLVCYLILDLEDIKCGMLQIGPAIEDALKRVLTDFGIKAYSLNELIAINDVNIDKILEAQGALLLDKNFNKHAVMSAAGVWVIHNGTPKKIASRGLKLVQKNRFTKYGFALNVSTDLSYFDYIYPCGLDIQMASVRLMKGKKYDLAEVAKKVAETLVQKFKEISGDDSHELL